MRFVVFASFLCVAACEYRLEGGDHAYPEPSTSTPAAPALADAGACSVTIDRWKELLVVDPAVIDGPDARNDVPGAAFSFRTRAEELAGGTDAARFSLAWLGSWPETRPAEPLAAPWKALRTEPSIADAPFRLVAIANRLDLPEPELRFVYTAVDPASRAALAMTAIVEIPYPKDRTARDWAEAWHAGTDLAALVRSIVRGADPSKTRVRTNEAIFGTTWEMRQFTIQAGALLPSPLPATPRAELEGSSTLDAWLEGHEPRLAKDIVDPLPDAMLGTYAHMPDPFFQWELAAPVSDRARRAFSLATCNGCHGGERPSDDLPFQHVAPWDAPATSGYYLPPSDGGTRISRYLNDPSRGDDELGRRAKVVAALLCSAPHANPYPGGTSCP